jgi:hypothetical protein
MRSRPRSGLAKAELLSDLVECPDVKRMRLLKLGQRFLRARAVLSVALQLGDDTLLSANALLACRYKALSIGELIEQRFAVGHPAILSLITPARFRPELGEKGPAEAGRVLSQETVFSVLGRATEVGEQCRKVAAARGVASIDLIP